MLGIGIIGLGRISGKHIGDNKASKDARTAAICDIDIEKLNTKGDELGIDQAHRFERYEDLIACPDVDAVEICTPNYLHCRMALAAARAGKPFCVEKPLDINLEATRALQEALREKSVPNMVCFTHRLKSAVRYAKEIIDEGLLGEIITVNVAYLQSGVFIPGRRFEWRFDKPQTGSGALADLGSHLLDMAMFLVGDITSVSGQTGTVVKKRKRLDSEEYADVLVDDYCNFIARFQNGASALFNITKCAIGHSNTIKFEVFGRDGIISFNLNEPDTLDVCLGKIDAEGNGLHTVKVPERYRVNQGQMFYDLILGREPNQLPTVEDGLRVQRVLDAVLASAEQHRVIDL